MTDSGFALQVAVIEALRAEAALAPHLGTPPRIYDVPPRDTAFAYVSLGPALLLENDTTSERSHVHRLSIDIWSRAGGRKEVRAILAAIEGALHDRDLTLQDHNLINLRFEFADVFRDPDGVTMRGAVRYRAVTEPL